MSDHDHYFALVGYAAQAFHEVSGNDAVQTGIGLIQHKEERIADIFHGDGKALSLAAGKLLNKAALHGGQSELVQNGIDALYDLRKGRVRGEPEVGGVHERAVNGVVTAHEVHLRDKADGILHLVVFAVDVHTPEENLGIGFLIAGDGVYKGCLAGTGSAQKKDHVAGLDRHEDLAEQIASVQEIADRAVFDFYRETVFRRFRERQKLLDLFIGQDRVKAVIDQKRLAGGVLVAESPDQSGNNFREYPEPAPNL